MTQQDSQREGAVPWGGGKAWERWKWEKGLPTRERDRAEARTGVIKARRGGRGVSTALRHPKLTSHPLCVPSSLCGVCIYPELPIIHLLKPRRAPAREDSRTFRRARVPTSVDAEGPVSPEPRSPTEICAGGKEGERERPYSFHKSGFVFVKMESPTRGP